MYIYIYIYIYLCGKRGSRLPQEPAPCRPTCVCEKNTPPEKNNLGKVSLRNTKSRGWRGVSAALPQGKGSPERRFLFTDTGILGPATLIFLPIPLFLSLSIYLSIYLSFYVYIYIYIYRKVCFFQTPVCPCLCGFRLSRRPPSL